MVEDALDTLPLLEELGRSGYEILPKRVSAVPEIEAALEEKQWDLVIADYDFSEFVAFAVLKLVREKGLKIPLIAVADDISQDVAVAALQAGVDEVVMKSNLGRLIPAVERLFFQSAARQEAVKAEEAGDEDMWYVANMNNDSADAVVSANNVGEVVHFNKNAEALLGYKKEEAVGQHLSMLFASDEEAKAVLGKMAEGADVQEPFEADLRSRDGREVPVVLSVSVLYDPDGRSTGVVCFFKALGGKQEGGEAQKRFARRQAAVAQFGSLALKGMELGDIMETAVVLAAEALGADLCEIVRLDEVGARPTMAAAVGWPEEMVGSTVFGGGPGSLAGYTLQEGAPVVVEDFQSESRFRELAPFWEQGVVSGICVPMVSQDMVFGLMGAHTKRRRAFHDDDILFLEAVARLVTTAALKQKASAVLQQVNQDLFRQVEMVEKTQEQLIRAEKAAATRRLSAWLSNEVLNPLSIVSMRLQMIERDLAVPPEMTGHVEALAGQLKRTVKMTRDLFLLSRHRQGERQSLDVNAALTKALGQTEETASGPAGAVEVELAEGLPELHGDGEQIQQVLANLIGAAREAVAGVGQVGLKTGRVEQGGVPWVEVRVETRGEELDKGRLEKTFAPLFASGAGKKKGDDLGLHLCREIILAHGGKVAAEEQDGRGADLVVHLPAASPEAAGA